MKPGPDFCLVSFQFQSLIKFLGILNKSNYDLNTTTYSRRGKLDNVISISLSIKVPTMILVASLEAKLKKCRKDHPHFS